MQIYIVDWDIPRGKRAMFYYYLKKLRKEFNLFGEMSTMSVAKVTDEEIAYRIFDIAKRFGRCNIYRAELLDSFEEENAQ